MARNRLRGILGALLACGWVHLRGGSLEANLQMTPQVYVALLALQPRSMNALMAIIAMVEAARSRGIQVTLRHHGNALVHQSRNKALVDFLRSSHTHILFVDDDMLPPPSAIKKLLDADKPVISGLCTGRQYGNVVLAAKAYDPRKDCFGQLETVNLTRVVTGPFAPGGAFLMMDRPTVESLLEFHLSAEDWVQENLRLFSRLRVRVEVREVEQKRIEKLRRELYEREGTMRVFDYPVNDQGLQLGEDICLGRKLLQLGIPVAIDGTTIIGHVGDHPYSVHDILAQEQVA